MNTLRLLATAFAVSTAGLLGSASALAQTPASEYRSITIGDGFADWAGVGPVFASDLTGPGPGSDGDRLELRNVYVANDADYLYIRFTTHEETPAWINWRFTVWINGDGGDANGFFSEGQPWKFRLIEGEGFQTVRDPADGASQFNDGAIGGLNYQFTGGSVNEVEMRISLSAVYADAQHPDSVANSYFNQPVFPHDTLTFRIVGNSVDDIAHSTGVIGYTLAAIPEPASFAMLAAAGVLGLAVLRRRGV